MSSANTDLAVHCCSCKAEELVMIGDRYLTDVVYGNRNGLFTIRPAPLTLEGEPSAVLFVSAALTAGSSGSLRVICCTVLLLICSPLTICPLSSGPTNRRSLYA